MQLGLTCSRCKQTRRENQELTCEESHGLASSICVPDTGSFIAERKRSGWSQRGGAREVELESGALTPRPLGCLLRRVARWASVESYDWDCSKADLAALRWDRKSVIKS